jgi:hypothetical protein
MTPQQRKARREFIQKRRYEGAKFPDILREMHGKPRQAAQPSARQKPAALKSTTKGRPG